MKRAIFLGLILFLGAASTLSAAEPAVVKLWNFNISDKKYQQKMYRLFNERHPDIRVEYSSISNTVYGQVLEAAFVAKDPPDLFLPGEKYTFNFLKEKDLIMPLNDVAPNAAELKDWMGKYPPLLRKFVEGISMFDGKVYTVDLQGETADIGFPMYYNKTLFKEAGLSKPPATQTEFRQDAAKITAAGGGKYFGLVLGLIYSGTWGMSLERGLSFAAGALAVGPPGWGPDRRDGLYKDGSPENLNALMTFRHMREDGSVFPGETTMEDEQAKMVFATNKAAMQFGGPWNVGNYLAYNVDCDFDLVMAPTPDDGIRKNYYYVDNVGGAYGYMVSRSAKHPAAVWDVIKFISGLEYQEGWVQGGFGVSYLPEANKPENYAHPQMYKFVEWASDPALKRIQPALSVDARKVYDYYPPLYPTHTDVETNVYMGKAGPEALQDLEKRKNAAHLIAIGKAQEAGLKVSQADFVFPDWDATKDYAQKRR